MTDAEIVEALATKVMGWTAYRCAEPNCQCHAIQYWRVSDTHIMTSDWNPLTGATASKQVREKLAERWNYIDLSFLRLTDGRTCFFVQIHGDGEEDIFSVENSDEFRAVALAALKTVGVEL